MPKGILADDFRVQTYRGQPVLTWWEGKTNPRGYGAGHVGDRRPLLPRDRPREGGRGLGGDLHDIELTDADTALIPVYSVPPT